MVNLKDKTLTITDYFGTTRVYDLCTNKLLSKTNKNGRKYEFIYNKYGKIVTEMFPDGRRYEYTIRYDENGNIL